MREPPGQHVTEEVQAALVERYLRKIGGGVTVSELAYQTRLPEARIIDALYELEDQGQAAPWAWTLGPEAQQSPSPVGQLRSAATT